MKNSLNVLVVENEETSALSVALYCWGHAPAIFTDAQAAFDEFTQSVNSYDAILIDVDLTTHEVDQLSALLASRSVPCLLLNTPSHHALTHTNNITLLESKNDITKLLTWLDSIHKPERVFDDKHKLFTLIYASHAVGDTTPSDVMDILKVARKINKELEVTGVLLYNKGWWLQVLEGSFTAVTSLFFDHIQKDKRHQNVTLLVLDPSTKRQFSNWDMGFYSSQTEQDANLSWTDLDTHPAGAFIKQKLSNAQDYTRYFMR